MRQPYWKTLLSYVHDIRIEDAPSYINPHLYVNLSKGRYQLATANAVYSYADLYGNFKRAFQKINWELLPGTEVLILGLGLGSIPYMLETRFGKTFRYTAVEMDEQIIYLAKKYVLDDLKSPMEIHHGDAVRFVHEASARWDLICVDLFIDDEIPDGAQTKTFTLDLKNRCTENGLILFNCLARTKTDIMKSMRLMHHVFLQVFWEGDIIDTQGNWIAVNDRRFFQPDAFGPDAKMLSRINATISRF